MKGMILVGLMVSVSVSVSAVAAQEATVSTLIGTGQPGFSNRQVNNPYGVVVGPDGRTLLLRPRQPADSSLGPGDGPDDHGRRERRTGP